MSFSLSMSCACEQRLSIELAYLSDTVFPRLEPLVPKRRLAKRFRSKMDQFVWIICPELREELAHYYKTGKRPLSKYPEYQLSELEDLLLDRVPFLLPRK